MKTNGKRLLLICLMLVMSLMLSGCVRVDASVTIKMNGKMDVSVMTASTGNYSGTLGSISEEGQEKLEEMGITCEDYVSGDYRGVILKKEDATKEEVVEIFAETGLLNGSASSDGEISTEVITQKDGVYEIRIPLGSAREHANILGQFGGYVRFSLTLPTATEQHNATSVSEDGKTLVWNLADMDDDEIYVLYKAPNVVLILIVAAAALLGLGLAITFIILGVKKKKNKQAKIAEMAAAMNGYPRVLSPVVCPHCGSLNAPGGNGSFEGMICSACHKSMSIHS